MRVDSDGLVVGLQLRLLLLVASCGGVLRIVLVHIRVCVCRVHIDRLIYRLKALTLRPLSHRSFHGQFGWLLALTTSIPLLNHILQCLILQSCHISLLTSPTEPLSENRTHSLRNIGLEPRRKASDQLDAARNQRDRIRLPQLLQLGCFRRRNLVVNDIDDDFAAGRADERGLVEFWGLAVAVAVLGAEDVMAACELVLAVESAWFDNVLGFRRFWPNGDALTVLLAFGLQK